MNDLSQIFKSRSIEKALIIVGLLGIVLIAFPKKDKEQPSKKNTESSYSKVYIEETEKKLEKTLRKIDGVGKVSVMITLESSEEVVYAQNEKESIDMQDSPSYEGEISKKESSRKEKTYVFSDYGRDRSALKISSTEPKIKGVIVVCEGGDSSLVRSKVIEACSVGLGIKYSNIFVAKSN